ncbi:putative F-box protein PP2-B12 isoform X1 [Mangifera indica]|uniref:putative F-box protein PP2-B12 isoform X1 n=1 Tax=Mangifera indica TaxID=29780 RepID=UPI001CFA1F6B|nr:putative F-box protein PP2-B12 isoform X1 [Mangifera indica]
MTYMANHHQQRTKLEQESPISLLPEGCIAAIISCTTPREACRLSLVSSIFKSAAESDVVWESFLPPDYQTIISKSSPCPLPFSSSTSSLLGLPSKKDLFLSLCNQPILIDDGKKSFSLDKQSGKICCMISSRDLMIVWGDTPTYWRWASLPGARFQEVAELIGVCWLEISGKISTRILSPGTNYAAYLVFKPTAGSYGFENQPVEVSVGLVGTENQKRSVYLVTGRRLCMQYLLGRPPSLLYRSRRVKWQASLARERGDDWLEVELGDFYNTGDENGELEISILETRGGHWKGGLIIQGIEIRPKQGV